MKNITTLGRSACFALAIAAIDGAAPAQTPLKLDCDMLAPSVQRQARQMSALLPEIEKTEVERTLKGKASG
jgi:hypothetical protein